MSIALEFRTSRTNGVLLAISNQASDGLGLEIVQGKVQNSGKYMCLLCGGEFHIDTTLRSFWLCPTVTESHHLKLII